MAYVASNMDVLKGKQQRLAISLMPEVVKQHQEKKAMARQKTIEKRYKKNFYVLDCETSGLKHNEPIQIAVLAFENGKETLKYNKFILPEQKITDEAE